MFFFITLFPLFKFFFILSETERSVSNSSNCVKESLLTNGADNRKYKNDDLETPPFELGRKAFSSSSKKRHAVEMSSESPYPSEARSNFNFCNVEGGKGAKQTGGVTPLSLFGDSNNWSSVSTIIRKVSIRGMSFVSL